MVKSFNALLTLAFILFSSISLADSTSLTTYYPAPTGNYKQIKLTPSDPPSADPCITGTMHVDKATNQLKYCNGIDWNVVITRRVNCPDGYRTIGAQDSPAAFCMENISERKTDLSTAITRCQSKGMHLCSSKEWYAMCSIMPRNSLNNEVNWVFELIPGGTTGSAMIMAKVPNTGECTWAATDKITQVSYRCCF